MKTPSSASRAGGGRGSSRKGHHLHSPVLCRALGLLTSGISHGRDHKLIVWRLTDQDEPGLDAVLPVEHIAQPRRQPWILHLLDVNTLNFCSFAACARRDGESICRSDAPSDILVAVPNTLASEAVSFRAQVHAQVSL